MQITGRYFICYPISFIKYNIIFNGHAYIVPTTRAITLSYFTLYTLFHLTFDLGTFVTDKMR
jgi:hypothetical protein